MLFFFAADFPDFTLFFSLGMPFLFNLGLDVEIQIGRGRDFEMRTPGAKPFYRFKHIQNIFSMAPGQLVLD